MATLDGNLAGGLLDSTDEGAKGRFVTLLGNGQTFGAGVVKYRLTVWDSGLGARVASWTDTEASLRAAPTPVGAFSDLTILSSQAVVS